MRPGQLATTLSLRLAVSLINHQRKNPLKVKMELYDSDAEMHPGVTLIRVRESREVNRFLEAAGLPVSQIRMQLIISSNLPHTLYFRHLPNDCSRT